MPSSKEIYNAEQARLREAQKRYEANEAESNRMIEAKKSAEKTAENKQQQLETEKDRVAKKFLQEKVAGQLSELKSVTGGKITTPVDREIRLEIRSEEQVFGERAPKEDRNIYHKWEGVEVYVNYDQDNQGHVLVNGNEVDPANLPQALADAATHPISSTDTVQTGYIPDRERRTSQTNP